MTDIDFRAEVRRAMERGGMTQAALARASGVPRPNISAWLSGRADITTSTLSRLLVALGDKEKLRSPAPADKRLTKD